MKRLADRFSVAGITVDEYRSGDWWVLVAPSHGLRLLQVGYRDEVFLWNREDPSAEDWCIGGNRTWIAPEFSDAQAARPGLFDSANGTWAVPDGLDPGPYRTTRISDTRWTGATGVSLWSGSSRRRQLLLEREIEILGRPEGKEHIAHVTIRQRITNEEKTVRLEGIAPWAITQVEASDTAYAEIPYLGDETPKPLWSVREGALDRELLQISNTGENRDPRLRIRLPAGRHFKIGLPPTRSSGRISYFKPGRNGTTLSVTHEPRNFVVAGDSTTADGSGPYEMTDYPDFGDIVQLFNAPGSDTPAFSEIENHWPAVSLAPGETHTSEYQLVFSAQYEKWSKPWGYVQQEAK